MIIARGPLATFLARQRIRLRPVGLLFVSGHRLGTGR